MLLFEHKHLHSYDAPSSMQTEILSSTGFLIDHIFKVNISDERGSDDRNLDIINYNNVCILMNLKDFQYIITHG